MDLKTRAAPPTDDERAAVESVLGAERPRPLHVLSGGHLNKARRHLLLPTLHAVNDRVGWISSTAIDHIAEQLDVSPAEIYGVASFYALFALEPRDPHQVHVCTDLACRANGGPKATDLPPGAHAAPCLGLCERAPAALVIDAGAPVDRAVAGHVTHVEIATWAAGGSPLRARLTTASSNRLHETASPARGDPCRPCRSRPGYAGGRGNTSSS